MLVMIFFMDYPNIQLASKDPISLLIMGGFNYPGWVGHTGLYGIDLPRADALRFRCTSRLDHHR